jgi:protein-disulfide isomerase
MRSFPQIFTLVFLVLLFGAVDDGLADEPSIRTQQTVATVNSAVVTSAELEEITRSALLRLRMEEYRVKRAAVNQLIGEMLLRREAALTHRTFDEYMRQEIEEKVAPITPAEVHLLLENAKDRFTGSDDPAREVAATLLKQRVARRRAELIQALRSKANVRVSLEPPRTRVSAVGPARGPETAAVTIVEFSDFQCPYCRSVAPTLRRIRSEYGDRVRFVFKHFPLPIHKDASKAAEAAACAEEQGRFWEMHDRLFAHARNLDLDVFFQDARDIGLDEAQFSECMLKHQRMDRWQADVAAGKSYGVSGTPTFFVNGIQLTGSVSFEEFAGVINEELERLPLSKYQ